MGLVLIVVHQLVEVGQVCLQCGPRGLHQILLTCHGLTRASIGDLVDLVAEAFNPLIGLAVVALECISAHSL